MRLQQVSEALNPYSRRSSSKNGTLHSEGDECLKVLSKWEGPYIIRRPTIASATLSLDQTQKAN